ncbi:MAG: hypothetical protein LBB13_00665 [Rickettsiales bacterium]|nr:hypothetical protein [Rickettsiales bacterium]
MGGIATKEVHAAAAVGAATGECLFGCICSLFKKCFKEKKNKQDKSSEDIDDEESNEEFEQEIEEDKEEKSTESTSKLTKAKRRVDTGETENEKAKSSKIQKNTNSKEDRDKDKEIEEDVEETKNIEKIKKISNETSTKLKSKTSSSADTKKVKKKSEKKKKNKEQSKEQIENVDEKPSDNDALKASGSTIIIIPAMLNDKSTDDIRHPDGLSTLKIANLGCLCDAGIEQQIIPVHVNTNSISTSNFVIDHSNVSEPVLMIKQPENGQETLELLTKQTYSDGMVMEQQPILKISSLRINLITDDAPNSPSQQSIMRISSPRLNLITDGAPNSPSQRSTMRTPPTPRLISSRLNMLADDAPDSPSQQSIMRISSPRLNLITDDTSNLFSQRPILRISTPRFKVANPEPNFLEQNFSPERPVHRKQSTMFTIPTRKTNKPTFVKPAPGSAFSLNSSIDMTNRRITSQIVTEPASILLSNARRNIYSQRNNNNVTQDKHLSSSPLNRKNIDVNNIDDRFSHVRGQYFSATMKPRLSKSGPTSPRLVDERLLAFSNYDIPQESNVDQNLLDIYSENIPEDDFDEKAFILPENRISTYLSPRLMSQTLIPNSNLSSISMSTLPSSQLQQDINLQSIGIMTPNGFSVDIPTDKN